MDTENDIIKEIQQSVVSKSDVYKNGYCNNDGEFVEENIYSTQEVFEILQVYTDELINRKLIIFNDTTL